MRRKRRRTPWGWLARRMRARKARRTFAYLTAWQAAQRATVYAEQQREGHLTVSDK